jgi:hypothetical protein
MRLPTVCIATLGLLAPTLAISAAETPAPAHAAASSLLGPGEAFGFQASWGIFPRAGRIDISAAPHAADNTHAEERLVTVRIATDGTIGRLYRYEAVGETLFATDTGRMQSASYRARAGKKRQERALAFDYARRVAHYRDALEPERNTTLALPEGGEPLDLITSLVNARRWNLAPGDTQEILVQVDDAFYPLLLRAGAIERLRTKRGDFSALVITPEPVGKPRGLFRRGGSLKIWVEDSPARLPLRIEVKGRFGTVTADLVHYVPPRLPPPEPKSI